MGKQFSCYDGIKLVTMIVIFYGNVQQTSRQRTSDNADCYHLHVWFNPTWNGNHLCSLSLQQSLNPFSCHAPKIEWTFNVFYFSYGKERKIQYEERGKRLQEKSKRGRSEKSNKEEVMRRQIRIIKRSSDNFYVKKVLYCPILLSVLTKYL